jgi:glycogen synthase
LRSGLVRRAGSFTADDGKYRLLLTNDGRAPVLYLEREGRFQGTESPYHTPELKTDTLVFGLGVNSLLRAFASPRQFLWGADWETVPALVRLRDRHHIALTLHNTFDECLAPETERFPGRYPELQARRDFHSQQTALEVVLNLADVVTTVNRGFAHGLRHEAIQRDLIAAHLRPYAHRIVPINNGSFTALDEGLLELERLLTQDVAAGAERLLLCKADALARLPADIAAKARGKVLLVTMGRRVAQKQHDVLVESVRRLLRAEPQFPLLAFFATVAGDGGSAARLQRMQDLQEEFPRHVEVTDHRLPYYHDLMRAADFLCLPSLYEPHGGAYAGIVVPIARAVDGLAEQICAYEPDDTVRPINRLWHAYTEQPTGLLFRETPGDDDLANLRELLEHSPSPPNPLFARMVQALERALCVAVRLRVKEFDTYVGLVRGTLTRQLRQSWLLNLGGMLSLIEEARLRRPLG